jgi:hypothetical protein
MRLRFQELLQSALPFFCEEIQRGILKYLRCLEGKYKIAQTEGVGEISSTGLVPNHLHETFESRDFFSSLPQDIVKDGGIVQIVSNRQRSTNKHFPFGARQIYKDFKFFGRYLSILKFARVRNDGLRKIVTRMLRFAQEETLIWESSETGMCTDEDSKRFASRLAKIEKLTGEFQ